MLPLQFESGVGGPAAVELTTSDEPVAAAGGPWRAMALFSGVALIFVIGLLGVGASPPERSRCEGATDATGEHRAACIFPAAGAPRPISVPAPG